MSSPVYYPESNLSQQSKSSLEVPQSQSESSQKRKRDETEFSQAEAMPMEGGVLSQNEVNLVDGQELPEAQIWGTDIIVGECLGHFDRFLKDFKDDSFEGLKYQRMLEDIEETQVIFWM